MITKSVKFTILITSTFFILNGSLSAADLSVGATSWYTAWNYKDKGTSSVKYDPGFLYGPVLSLSMTDDISMSFVFLYGQFKMTTNPGSPSMMQDRYDSDLTLNYKIGSYFKLFAGVKFLGFTWPEDGSHLAIGSGAGISSVLPLGGNFFLLGYLSGMYLRGEEIGDKSRYYKINANEVGGNASISLAYYIPSASTTISLGGRYQQLNIYYTSQDVSAYAGYDSISKFYGVTLTAVYTFNL